MRKERTMKLLSGNQIKSKGNRKERKGEMSMNHEDTKDTKGMREGIAYIIVGYSKLKMRNGGWGMRAVFVGASSCSYLSEIFPTSSTFKCFVQRVGRDTLSGTAGLRRLGCGSCDQFFHVSIGFRAGAKEFHALVFDDFEDRRDDHSHAHR